MGHRPAATVGLLALALWLFSGCARPPVIPVPEPARDWMHRQSGAHRIDGSQVFFGIGKAAGVRNATLLRAAADNRARDEMARVLRAYVMVLAEATGLEIGEAAERQGLNGLARTAWQHARIVDHWFDPADGAMLSLCRLDLDAFKAILQAEPQLDAPLRHAMLERAEQAHARLADRP